MTEATFSVTVRSLEPPPDWANKIHEKLSEEIRLIYGDNATCTPQPLERRNK